MRPVASLRAVPDSPRARRRGRECPLIALLLVSLGFGDVVSAQTDCADGLDALAQSLRWTPTTPSSGTLFKVLVGAGSADRTERARMVSLATRAALSVAGEPLHFQRAGDSLFALAAVPIDSTVGVTIDVRCGDEMPATARVSATPGEYRLERLRVAPRFSAAPDSALAQRMRREAAQAAEVSRASHDTPAMWLVTPFRVPRPSRITSGFGGGRMFNGIVTSRHMGTDYAGTVGAPVVATNRGIVRLVGAFYLGGNVIYLDHGAGVVSAYLHLSQQLVAVGDTVRAGALIGRVGATGRVTGPHLHFIARYGTITIDPASLMASTARDTGRTR